MKAATLEALKKSIKKWERIVETTTAEDNGQKNCALCERFFTYGDERLNVCRLKGEKCPVFAATGVECCDESPYRKWDSHRFLVHFKSGGPRKKGCRLCMKYAKEELAFLKSLLPDGKK